MKGDGRKRGREIAPGQYNVTLSITQKLPQIAYNHVLEMHLQGGINRTYDTTTTNVIIFEFVAKY